MTIDKNLNTTETQNNLKHCEENEQESHEKCLSDGSISGSITNLCSSTLGAGTLSLPYAISKAGIIIGVCLLIIAGCSTHFSIMLLSETMQRSKCKTYESMTFHYYGRSLATLVEACIIIFCFGCATAYIIAVGDLLDQTLLTYFNDSTVLPSSLLNRQALMIAFWAIVMFPLSLIQRINSLRFASLLSVMAVYVLIIAIMYHSIKFMAVDNTSHTYNLNYWPESVLDVFLACPIIMFAFGNQINVCQIYFELKNPSPNKMIVVSAYSNFLSFSVYTLVGVFAYIDFQTKTDEDILSNYCLGSGNPDWFMMISSCVFVIFGITLGFPFNILPCRLVLNSISHRILSHDSNTTTSLDKHLLQHPLNAADNLTTSSCTDDDSSYLTQNLLSSSSSSSEKQAEHQLQENLFTEIDNEEVETELSTQRNFILTLFIAGLCLIFAIFLPDISVVFGLMGGSASACICFIMPALLYFKSHPFSQLHDDLKQDFFIRIKYFFIWVLCLGGFLIGALGTAVTLWNIFQNDATIHPCSS